MQIVNLFCASCAFISGLALTSPSRSGTPSPQRPSVALYTSVKTGRNIAPQKCFHELTSRIHYDTRFVKGALSQSDRHGHLSALVRAYLSTMDDIGTETWLMHGSLLGWFWNGRIMPWDADVDVQITEKSMQHLADYYNMTVHRYSPPGSNLRRDYLLEINPKWADPSTSDVDSKIDGRWLDMETGLFIDIATLRYGEQDGSGGGEGVVMCKDGHRYRHRDIFPLRTTTFEGVPARVPFAYANVLTEEYGASSLSETKYKHHVFDRDLQEWLSSAR
ncbi:putative mannosylphosphorylation protein [Venturia nashicola]|nr:putative mannosylphosphorylation protein [Venturia nashicola]